HCIGLITGKDSDAEKDVLRNAQLRWPQVRFRTVHTAVQGDRTVGEVSAAIEALDADPEVVVIIIARGGGDFQNLVGFSDERLVRTAEAARTPIVSAIGHEADRPILDEVADLRASTPTDAAKRVVPDVAEELARVQQARSRLTLRLGAFVRSEFDRVQQLRSRPALANPAWLVDTRAEEVARAAARGREIVDRRLELAAHRVEALRSSLRALSPQSTLDRGYAIAQIAGGDVLRDAADAPRGTELTPTLAGGAITATAGDRAPRPGDDPASARPESAQTGRE
ncbi:MAG: exodeoxyribonuclease VII large subunit, partial [Microbacteriaceae bacterium]